MWALVPLKPNELTAPMRGPPTAGHGVGATGTSIGSRSQAMCGFGSAKCRIGATSPCCSVSTSLIRPATPAADSRCPMFDLAEPISRRDRSSRPAPSAAPSAWASIGSPSAVPVPWVST
jgi:hypothetical protein